MFIFSVAAEVLVHQEVGEVLDQMEAGEVLAPGLQLCQGLPNEHPEWAVQVECVQANLRFVNTFIVIV